ncbi:type II toxin-antitoxin system death-on-curing family toxin [Yersinia bercovieri]|uniref:type II toxin-antitoxin system death-on-curing family toxin n=1 Tax=Yersinia bercovieri TaxID=634 RepID=UPI0011AB6411|nr:type II toxin-antitoxin system death-on-curing family toxin [Yersinia bercovieri]
MDGIIFLNIEQVINIQSATLPTGAVVDRGKLTGALARVENHQHYNNCNDIFELAAMYLISIAKSHAFADANKRTAFISCASFLRANGIQLAESSFYLTKLTVMVAGDKVDRQETASLLALMSDFYHVVFDDEIESYDEEKLIYFHLTIAAMMNDALEINEDKTSIMESAVVKLISDKEVNAITEEILADYLNGKIGQ